MNEARTEVLKIEADFFRLGNVATRRVLHLATVPSGVVVDIALYKRRQINRPNCDNVVINEVGVVAEVPEVWRAVRGRLEIARGPKRRAARGRAVRIMAFELGDSVREPLPDSSARRY